MDFRGRPFDFWGGYGWFQRKCPADWFRQEKSMQYIWEKNMRSCQPFSGWGKKRIWHLCKCHLSTKWLARDHDVVVSETKVLHFKIENTPIKDTNGKRKFKRMLSFLLWTNESFSLWNCLSKNSTLFSTRRIGALGLFLTNQGSEASEDTWGTFRTLWSKKSVRFQKGIFEFIKVSWTFSTFWHRRERKTTKCAFEIDFLPCARPIQHAWTQRFNLP